MLKENIDVAQLQLSDPLITAFNLTFNDIWNECHSIAEVLAMARLFKTLAIQRQDFITANRFRDLEVELRRQAAAFEATWAWMNATQMQDEIKKQVAALLPMLSFRPELGTVEKSPSPSCDDGPNYGNSGNERTRTSRTTRLPAATLGVQPNDNTPFMTAEGA